MKYICMEQRLIVNSVRDPVTECWDWIGRRDKRASTPYGFITIRENGKPMPRRAHRISYETFRGPIPAGHEIDHMCRNPACINPDHLAAVTPTVNKGRRVFKHTAKSTAYLGPS